MISELIVRRQSICMTEEASIYKSRVYTLASFRVIVKSGEQLEMPFKWLTAVRVPNEK